MTHEALRQARECKGWSIDDLARRAGLRGRTVELIEGGHFEELPAGLYGRSSIRSYATAVGLDAQEVLEAFGPLVPSTEDPLDGLARRCGHVRRPQARAAEPAAPAPVARPPAAFTPAVVMNTPAVTAPATFEPMAAEPVITRSSPAASTVPDIGSTAPIDAYALGGDDVLDIDLDEPAIVQAAVPDPFVAEYRAPITLEQDFDLLLADEEPLDPDEPWTGIDEALVDQSPRSIEWWRPLAAAGIDLCVLGALGAVLVWLTAIASETTIPLVVRSGGLGIALVFAVIVGLYFVLFGGVGNATPGGSVMGLDSRMAQRTVLNPRDVFARAYRSVYRDNGLAADDQPVFAERG